MVPVGSRLGLRLCKATSCAKPRRVTLDPFSSRYKGPDHSNLAIITCARPDRRHQGSLITCVGQKYPARF